MINIPFDKCACDKEKRTVEGQITLGNELYEYKACENCYGKYHGRYKIAEVLNRLHNKVADGSHIISDKSIEELENDEN